MSLSKNTKSLAALLSEVEYKLVRSGSDKPPGEQGVVSLTADSREAVPGSVFVAVRGGECDGHDYIFDAVERGCHAVVCGVDKLPKAQIEQLKVTVIEVGDTAKTYASMAANYFDRPADKLHFIGVTGTNGKTTVTYLLEHVMLKQGKSVGVIGTVNNRYTTQTGNKKVLATRFTTPEALLLQELLREMVDAGVEYVVMEVSSHGLAQSRADGILFDIAAFTNLSRDHLDYHSDMEEYFGAKTRLFSECMKPGATAVLPQLQSSSDSEQWLRPLYEICSVSSEKIVSWGDGEHADIRLLNFSTALDRTDLLVATSSGRHEITSPLVGGFNAENLMTVFAICSAMGLDAPSVCNALVSAGGAPGRLERVSAGVEWRSKGPTVLVDYAHTPDALEKVLQTAKELPHNKLIGVFGCGGDRDNGKRPVMGEIVARLCDVAIVTDDNPRSEDPDKIVHQILVGMEGSIPIDDESDVSDLLVRKQRGCVVIRDRREAIEAAIRGAAFGDIVVIAGKGHEPYQLTRSGKRFFDDRQEAKRVLFSWTADLVAEAVGGVLYGEESCRKLLGSIITDSRIASQNGIFVALKGDSHDGHDFVEQVVRNGTPCVIVEKKITFPPELLACQVIVSDTLKALGDLAAFRRKKLAKECNQLVVGLTGSCGKTTVKEMVAAILARTWPEGPDFPPDCVLKTKGNFNNLIGMPLSLLPLDVHHKVAVMEMGMNQPGELARLGEIGCPDISCITNVHGAHLERLGSIEGVAKAKEELFAITKPEGTLIINLNDSLIRALSSKYSHRKITFGTRKGDGGEHPDFRASDIIHQGGGKLTFTLHQGKQTAKIDLNIAGEHNVSNALCASAIAFSAGATLNKIVAGLADFSPPDKRMQMLKSTSGFTILNDTYNANPGSMAAGLKTAKQVAEGAVFAIVGDMLELGESAAGAHYEIGKLIAELGIDRAGAVGEFRTNVQQGALDHGFTEERFIIFDEKKEAVAWINEMVESKKLGQDDLVLVKASRGLRFETIVAELAE